MDAIDTLDLKRYECPACDQRFATLPEKKVHLMKVHPRPAKPNNGRRRS